MLQSIILAVVAIFALAACQATTSSSTTASKTTPGVETVAYASSNVGLFREVFAGKLNDNPVKLKGKLHLPEGNGPFPVVIWQHGSGSPNNKDLRQWRTDLRSELAGNGIGLFIADSYSGRGISSTGRDQSKLSAASRQVDALQALSALAKHSRVNPDRIGIAGNSYGGIIAFRVSHEPYAEAVLPDGPRFAAHVAFYPSCQTRYKDYQSTGAPILFLLGEADDYTLAAPCVEQVKILRQEGVNVDAHVYAGAHHGFISSNAVKYRPRNQVFSQCGIRIMTRDGEVITDYANTKTMSRREMFQKFIDSGCIRRGAHVGRNDSAAKDALKRTVGFFIKQLGG